MISFPVPLLGFCAWSGTGKTTLLTRLLPLLTGQGLRVGMVKHAHHQFDIDHPNKDSYRLRHAGATQMLIASRKRMAWISEFDDDHQEPTLAETLAVLQPDSLDLVLVEGFKKENFAKIELHRPSLGRPLFYPQDENIIAVAADDTLAVSPGSLPLLDLNQPDEISQFILNRIRADDRQHTWLCEDKERL